MHGAEAQTAVLGGPGEPEPALGPDLAAEGRHFAVGDLEAVLGDLGAQVIGDVLLEELPHLGQPGLLGGIQLEVHAPYVSDARRDCSRIAKIDRAAISPQSRRRLSHIRAPSRLTGMTQKIRIDPVPPQRASLLTRIFYRMAKRRFGEVPEPFAVAAHHPRLMMANAVHEGTAAVRVEETARQRA